VEEHDSEELEQLELVIGMTIVLVEEHDELVGGHELEELLG